MRLLFDIGHPAHVHLFRNYALEMQEEGHDILFTTRERDVALQLLKGYGLPFHSMGKTKKGIPGKVAGMFEFNRVLLKIARAFKPDIFLSHGSIYAAQVSKIVGKPHISFEDTGNREQIMLYKPFTDAILVSDSFSKHFGKKTVVYPGYHELAYLHPKRFRPEPGILEQYGLEVREPIVLMRFVSWEATHDLSHTGIPFHLKKRAVDTFSQFGRVLISSEKELPEVFQPFQIRIDPVDIFHIMAFSSLLFGESGTMTSEAAVLGIPAIFIDSSSRDYTREQEAKYGLVYNLSETQEDIERAIRIGKDILSNPAGKSRFSYGHNRLLSDKVDVTAFLKEFVFEFAAKRSANRIAPGTNTPSSSA